MSCLSIWGPEFLYGVFCGILLTFIGLEAVRRWRSTKSSPCVALIECDINAGDQILQEAVKLFLMQTRPINNKSSTKVVEYLSPEEMLEQLFAFDKTISLNLDPNPTRDCKKQVDQDRYNYQQHQKIEQITHCFRLIQKYSVNTNHPYFFNQLFGAVDPVALAGEIIALSVNTSAYTYETAPVFTMIERNVIENLGRLVFGEFDKHIQNDCDNDDDEDDDDDDDDDDKSDTKRPYERNDHDVYDQVDDDDDECQSRYTGCDGLMLPGGSLSNLTALHVARHYAKYGIQAEPPRSQILSNIHNDNLSNDDPFDFPDEEKKLDSYPMENEISSDSILASSSSSSSSYTPTKPQQEFVAFVSSEAHYSFSKAISVTGIGIKNLVVVPTLPNGAMDVNQLDVLMTTMYYSYGLSRIPFFVGVTSGSTVRGSFDDIEAIVRVCRKHEERLNSRTIKNDINRTNDRYEFDHRSNAKKHKIWIHVDGAWGGSAIFSSRPDIRGLMRGVQRADSFTFNPHKMFGAPQQTTAFISRHKVSLD
jgi:glutamate/tyrosine decarboxylase-like PLP-dependent enzyme